MIRNIIIKRIRIKYNSYRVKNERDIMNRVSRFTLWNKHPNPGKKWK